MITMTEKKQTEKLASRTVKDLPALLQVAIGTPVRVNYNNRDDWMIYWGVKDEQFIQLLPDSTTPQRQNNSPLPILIVNRNDINFAGETLSFTNPVRDTYNSSHPEYSERKSILEASGLLLK